MASVRETGAVRVEGLVRRNAAGTVVGDVDLEVAEREIVGIVGPPGAGKTALLETVVGLEEPYAGRVRVFGLDPIRDSGRVRRLIAVQTQHGALPPTLTVAETVRLWASFRSRPADPEKVMAALGLDAVRGTRVGGLAPAHRMCVRVATALVARPRLLVLDEPYLQPGDQPGDQPGSALDPRTAGNLWGLVRQYSDTGGTTLLATRSFTDAGRYCDRVAIMDRGRFLACAEPATLIHEHAAEDLGTPATAAGTGEGDRTLGVEARPGALADVYRRLAPAAGMDG